MKTITKLLKWILETLDDLLGWAWGFLYRHGDKDEFGE